MKKFIVPAIIAVVVLVGGFGAVTYFQKQSVVSNLPDLSVPQTSSVTGGQVVLAAASVQVPDVATTSPCLSQDALKDAGTQITQNPFQFSLMQGFGPPSDDAIRDMAKKWGSIAEPNPDATFAWDKTVENFDKGRNIYNCESDIIVTGPIRAKSVPVLSGVQVEGAGKTLGRTLTASSIDDGFRLIWGVTDHGLITPELSKVLSHCVSYYGQSECLYVMRSTTQSTGKIDDGILRSLQLRVHLVYQVTKTLQGAFEIKVRSGQAYPNSFFHSLDGSVKANGVVKGQQCFVIVEGRDEIDGEVPCDEKAAAAPLIGQAPSGEGMTIVQPTWIKKPTAQEVFRVYPKVALAKEKDGRADLLCAIAIDGTPTCRIAKKSVAGYGFGDAAMIAAKGLQATPMFINGKPTGDGRLSITFNFSPPS